VSETLRVNGHAVISTDPALTESFAVQGKAPRCVLIVAIERVYFHCAKALVRSRLWDAGAQVDRKSLPSTGTIVAELTAGQLGGEAYDRELPARVQRELY
jgi:hypothetical protein